MPHWLLVLVCPHGNVDAADTLSCILHDHHLAQHFLLVHPRIEESSQLPRIEQGVQLQQAAENRYWRQRQVMGRERMQVVACWVRCRVGWHRRRRRCR